MTEKVMLCKEIYFPYNHPDWIAEKKGDGDNITIFAERGNPLKMLNRRGVDVSYRYPEFKTDHFINPNSKINKVILASELVVYNNEGKSDIQDFHRLSKRSHLADRHKIKLMSKHLPAIVEVYDILQLNEVDFTERGERHTLKARKLLLAQTIIPNERVNLMESYSDCIKLFEQQKKEGKEGIIMKNLNSIYEFKRSDNWLKVKNWIFSKVTYSSYEINKGKTGITLYHALITARSNDYGKTFKPLPEVKEGLHRVSCNGKKSHKVRELLDRDKEITVIVRHLATHHNPNALREPTFKGLIEDFIPIIDVKINQTTLLTT